MCTSKGGGDRRKGEVLLTTEVVRGISFPRSSVIQVRARARLRGPAPPSATVPRWTPPGPSPRGRRRGRTGSGRAAPRSAAVGTRGCRGRAWSCAGPWRTRRADARPSPPRRTRRWSRAGRRCGPSRRCGGRMPPSARRTASTRPGRGGRGGWCLPRGPCWCRRSRRPRTCRAPRAGGRCG